MALQKGIHVHIHLPDEGLPVVSKPKTSKPKPKSTNDDLIVRLTNRDALDDSELATLQGEVVSFVQSKLKANDMKGMKNFLQEAKHILTPELRDIIADEIKLSKR